MHSIFNMRRFVAITLCFLLIVPAAFAKRYETLRPGQSGNEIKNMQEALVFLRYPIKADGKYGPLTEDAVKAFQLSQKLYVDGLAGSKTLSRLYALAPQFEGGANSGSNNLGSNIPSFPQNSGSVPNIGGGFYRMGDESANIRLLQDRLNSLGYDAGRADAVFGRKTLNALKQFQLNAGLAANGRANQNTFDVLFSNDAPRALATAIPQETPVPQATPIPPINPGQDQGGTKPAPPISGGFSSAFVDTPNKGSLNFRSVPKQYSGLIKTIPNGTAISVINSSNGWTEIFYDGRRGYVMSKFLNFSKPSIPNETAAPNLPDAPAPTDPSSGAEQPDIDIILRLNAKGAQVRLLQERLNALGYSVNVNSIYDSKTLSAVKEFQRKNGLKQDGVAGKQTKTMLYSDAALKYSEKENVYALLKIDDKNAAVGAMQKRLQELGYTVNVNDVFDMRTHQAVVAFQSINGLPETGRAEVAMQQLLFSNAAKKYDSSYAGVSESEGRDISVSKSQVKLLHWYKDIKPGMRAGQRMTVYHPGSGISFTLRLYSAGHHADSEPLTLKDTTLMNRALGAASWNTRGVYVKLPNGQWTVASMHNRPHLTGAIKDNGFDGHLCVHFLRDMEETKKNDPNYGVTNQKTIRSLWKGISGEELDY